VTASRRRGHRGQAVIETAVVIAVLLSLLMGVYSVSQFASDQNTAGTATRSGARLASELGNGGYPGAITSPCQLGNAKDPCAVDRQIVQVVCQIAAAMPFVSSVDEVDIYQPTVADGGDGHQVAGDLVDKYTSCTPGTNASVTATYTLDKRVQTHPNEAYVGVSVMYHYKSPTPIFPLATAPTVYTVVLLSPHFT
jgi:Flp pilus assembly protein TadG